MKRFLAFIATFSLVETIGRNTVIAGVMTLIGVGGAVGIAMLSTPTLLPQVSANFNPNQAGGVTNNGLKPNGGTGGALAIPAGTAGGFTGSFAQYFEINVDPNLALTNAGGSEALFPGFFLTNNASPGQPSFVYQQLFSGAVINSYFWQAPYIAGSSAQSATAGSNYAGGFFPFTASGGGCSREPAGVWVGTSVQITDPGFGCQTPPTFSAATVPNAGAQQTGITATCAAGASGFLNITTSLAVSPGLSPGLTYPVNFSTTGGTPTNLLTSATLTAVSVTGSGPYSLVGTIAGTVCPTSIATGTVMSGASGAFTFPALAAIPLTTGNTGITTKNGQHICAMFGEYGDDAPSSALVGSQFLAMVDDKGSPLPGAPALVLTPNMGTANFTGYTTVGSATMTVTAMNPYTVSAASFNASTGFATFTMASNPGFVPGSQFTISGATTTGGGSFNLTYAAVGGTSGTTVVANPLSGPGGTPQVSSLTGSSVASSGSAVSVIFPGMTVWGTAFTAAILPYGAASTTGTGGTGTYQLTASQVTFNASVTSISAPSGGFSTMTLASSVSPLGLGATFTIPGYANPVTITQFGTGTGGAGTYTVSNTNAGAIGAVTGVANGGNWSSGTPGGIFAYSSFYYTAAGSANPAGGLATVRAGPFDFATLFGSISTTLVGSHNGWGGSIGNMAFLTGAIPSQSGGAPSTSDLASICTKATDIQAYAKAKSLTVRSLYRLNDIGIFGDSGNATVTGYITNPGGAAATLNIVSTPYGSLALGTGTETAKLTGVGLPVASPVTIGLSTTCSPGSAPLCVGATYPISPNTTAALGSLGSPVNFAVGAFAPALPLQANTLKGYIDTTTGVSTLHVSSLDDGTAHSGFASFTGTLGTSFTAKIDNGSGSAGNTLTVTLPITTVPANAYIGIGTQVCPAVGSGAFTCANVTALGTGVGYNGTYTLDGSAQLVGTAQVMFGSGALPGPATTLQATSVTGTIAAGMVVTDGGASITGAPLLITAGSGSVWTVAGNYYAPISGDTTMQATLTTLVPGEYLQNAAITNPVKIVADPSNGNGLSGTYRLSGSPNASNAVGTSGSPVVITGTTITDGGAIAPGPALTIRDQGPSVTFPLTNISAKTGTLTLSGTYDTGTLGGTPTGIQVLVSNSANGPPLAGCTPCNWGSLSSTIAAGKWSGTLAGIPGGGPYFVSVRATNGTAYATLPNSIKVGWVFALWGQGQANTTAAAQGGLFTSFFSGLWGEGLWSSIYSGNENYLQGPPIAGNFVPGQASSYGGDRFGISTSPGVPLSEAFLAFDQELTNAYGVPTTFLSPTRDGIGVGIFALGNVTQTQTVGAGDGSTLAWCSASKFCASAGVSPSAQLVFDAASLTGAWFTGSATGGVLTATTRVGGALEPGMVLNTTNAPTLVQCLTGCSSQMAFSGSTWQLSNSLDSVSGVALRADPVGSLLPFGSPSTPWPSENIQQAATTAYTLAGFGTFLVKAGTFKISVNGTVVCQDSATFAYNQTGGNCTGATIASSFVNYQTGDYQVTFTSGNAPASSASIIATWTNIVTTTNVSSPLTVSRGQGIDLFGDGTAQSGAVSNLFSKAPGGVNGQIISGWGTDHPYMLNSLGPSLNGYQYAAGGYSQIMDFLFGTKFPALIPGASPSVSFMTTGQWRVEGPVAFGNTNNLLDGSYDQWAEDVATQSIVSGQIASNVLTLKADTTFPMWEGEILNCAPVTTNCTNGPLSGVYILGLHAGSPAAWGKNNSTYDLAGSPANVSVTSTMQNPVYYSGAGSAVFVGTLNDILVQSQGLSGTTAHNPHTASGFTGARRATSRWAALIYGAAPGNATPASDPQVDRVKADAGASACDLAALASPCFDVGTAYMSSFATATWSGNLVTISGGIAAHARPFVVGQAFSCASCASGLVITSLSVPPTQSTVAGAGEVGQTFTFTAKNAAGASIGGSGTGVINAGCSGTSGTGSNCIDVAIAINVSGTFGTAASIATCGANNINGNAPNYVIANGKCQDNGIGEIVRTFRIGTTQPMYGSAGNPATGSVFDDGADMANGSFNQSAAFTCNIVAAKVVQCVKGPAYSSGAFSSVGQWSTGSTYVNYGDVDLITGRLASLLGYVGGQSFPFTAGSGYTNGTTQPTVTCSTLASGGVVPKFDVTVVGGAIINVSPSSVATGTIPVGLGIGSTCTVALPAGGSGGAISTISLAPVEGVGGIATYATDSNTMGMFLYDNSGFPGNPLNQFFTNGGIGSGYFEPGLPLRPFGMFQGAAVSG